MEVIPSTARGSGSMPLHQHNVEEWSRLDDLTGMLEHARVETGHWTANTSTSSQQYGKVVDSRARNLADGSMQQRQRKQLEVFQAQVPGGSLQVIRTQSVTSTSSSSSSWRATLHSDANVASDFENIQLSVKPLDLSTQKTKASVGRSGSIGSRRPPSRPRSIISKVDTAISEKNLLPNAEKENVDQRLSEMSTICRKIHEESKNNLSNSLLLSLPESSFSLPALSDNTVIKADNINRRDCIDVNKYSCTKSDKENSLSALGTFSDRAKKADETVSNGHVHAIKTRNKSCSIEDLQNNNHNEKHRPSERTEMSTDLARTSGIRRSLQLPNRVTHLCIPNGNVSKFCQELQHGKALDAVKTNATGFEALENIFKCDSGSERGTSLLPGKNNQACAVVDKSGNGYELAGSGVFDSTKGSSCKRHSFVTVESLKEVRGRLKHLSTPLLDDVQQPDTTKCQTRHVEDSDDGIVIEDFSKSIPGINSGLVEQVSTSHVKSYMYGVEAMANGRSNTNKSVGTGSLESRTSNRSGSSGGSRSEEWYSRRKSYGFEQVHNQSADNNSEPVTFKEKIGVESSTDSGICRSSETVTASSWVPFNREKANDHSTYGNLKANNSIKIKQHINDGIITETENKGNEINSQRGGRTVVTFGSDSEGNKRELHVNGGKMMETSPVTVSNTWVSGCDSRATNSVASNTSAESFSHFSEPVTVTIPIVHDDSFNDINGSGFRDAKKLYLKHFSEGSSLSTGNEWRKFGNSLTSGNDSPQKNVAGVSKTLAARRELFQQHSGGNDLSPTFRQTDHQIKRHSIAVDECKYVRDGLKNYNLYDKKIGHINSENMFKTSSTSIPDLENCTGLNLSNNKYAVPFHKELECKIPIITGMSQDGSDFKPASFTFENADDGDDDDELLLQNHLAGKKHKKVEFCKTEVHFAAEPGRFNIVETDEKPPPNNIRRRRRSSSCAILSTPQMQDAGKTSLPEIRFGDSPYEMKLLGGTESNNKPYQIDVSADTCNKSDLNHSVHIVPVSSFSAGFQDDADNIFAQEDVTMLSTGRQDTVEIEVHSNEKDVCSDSVVLQPNSMTSTSPRPRSILKNSKSPRFFHLGETDEGLLISALNGKSEPLSGDPETKWGVRLKPIHKRDLPLSSTSSWKSPVTLQNSNLDDQRQHNYRPLATLKDGKVQFPHSYVEGTELSKPLKSFEPSFQNKSADNFVGPMLSNTHRPESGGGTMEVKLFMAPSWSVAERVRQVEDLNRASLEARGYSTKVNLVSGKTTVIDSRLSDEQQKQSIPVLHKYQKNNHQKSICLHIDEKKEEAMHLCDMRSQTASDKGLVVHICKNIGSNDEDGHEIPDSNMKMKSSSTTADIKSSNVNKTTTILIDISAVPSRNCVTEMGVLKNEFPKKSENEESDKSAGTLRSPSLIMKTITSSSKVQAPEENKKDSFRQCTQGERQMNGSCINRQTEVPVAALRTKKMNIQSQNCTNKYRSDLYMKTTDYNTDNELIVEKTGVNNEGEEDTKEEALVVCNQLAVLKELYLSADLSDDSELADEEVRSYMSGGGDEDDRVRDVDSCSMVSGSWSRMRPFRNIQHHFHKFNIKQKDHADGSSMLKLDKSKESSLEKSVTGDNLQSYISHLHPKETLVSTHSVSPKITSISLQYKEEQSAETSSPRVCDTNSDCDRYQSSFHSSPSRKKGNWHVNDFECPTDFKVNASSTTTSIKSCNKSLFTLQNCDADLSKSLTQKHKRLLPSFVESNFEPERHTLHFAHDERNYGNLNPRTQKRGNNNCLDTDQTLSLVGTKVLYPEAEDQVVSHHNHSKHGYFPKRCSKQEADPVVLSNNMSLSSVLNKTTNKNQEKNQFHVSVPMPYTASVSSSSSNLISNWRNSSEDKKERIKVREEEMKKDGHFHTKTLSDENHKHSDRMFNHESEKETQISNYSHEGEGKASRVMSTSSLSMKYDRSVSLGGRVHSGKEMTMSPVYENMKMLAVEPTTKSSGQNLLTNAGETESDILEELTQAADQILQAVIGYTDEESCRASSDDPDDEIVQGSRRRRGNMCRKVQRPLVGLGTITETPSSKKQQETRNRTSELRSHKSTGTARKSQQMTKTRPHPTSSTSSLESFTREISQVQKRALFKQEGLSSADNCNRRTVESNSTSTMPIKSGSRTARLFQRANSREHLLQTYTSSSEDVASGMKGDNNRKPLVLRCTRSHNSSNSKNDPPKSSLKKSTGSPDIQPTLSAKVRTRKRDPDSNIPKERLPMSSNRMDSLVRKSSGGDSVKPSGGKLNTFRPREDRHQRGSSRLTVKRETADLRHRAQGGSATTMEPSVHDKNKRTVIYERRVLGSMGGIGLSSPSCVVPRVYPTSASSVDRHDNSRTKKKLDLASSHNKELVKRKAAK